jgi:hypothetical protein
MTHPFVLALAAAVASPTLPDIDQPLKTGASSSADAAVVIGIEDYLLVPDVPFARRDAHSVYDLLVYTKGIPTARVHMLDSGASREQMLEAATAAGKSVKSGGTVWVYFAGHGAADTSTGRRLLLGDDVRQDPSAFGSRGVAVDEISALAGAGGGHVVLILDACYGGVGRGGEELVAGKRFLVPTYDTKPKARTLEWTAAGPDQLSGPFEAARHGAFTYFAVGALRGWADGQIDGKRDGKVTAEEAQLYVKDALDTVQVRGQEPSLVAADARAWVLSSGSEPAPKLDASLAATSGTTGAAGAAIPLDVTNRDGVTTWLDAVAGACHARHAPETAEDWYVRFKVATTGEVKGLVITASTMPADPGAPQAAMHTCMRERIKAQAMVPPSREVKVQEHLHPRPATVASAPASAAPTSASTTTHTPGGTVTTHVDTTSMTVTVPGVTVSTSITGDPTATPIPLREPAPVAQPSPAVGPVRVILRSLDGSWVDVYANGKLVAEMRNDQETSIALSPGVFQLEFRAFMADHAFANGRLDTAGANGPIEFGVSATGGVTCYNHDGWR